jgi:superoxide dismutase, Cu-Zn family
MKHLLIITSVVVFGAAAVAAQQGAPMRAHADIKG